jgi:ABC-2 type transport system permease protein
MLSSVFTKTLRDRRRGFLYWALGLVAFIAMEVAVYPTVRDNPSFKKLGESYPEAVKSFFGFGGQFDITSGAGFLGIEAFSMIVPLMLIFCAVAAGANAIAGEEERGTLDLLLSLPLSRSRCLLEKLAALLTETLALGLVLWTTLVIAVPLAKMHVSVVESLAATLLSLALARVFGMIALAVGAASGRRGLAIGVSAALAVATYVLNSLASLVSWLEHVQWISPFYYYARSDPLRNGLDISDLLILLAIALVAACLAPIVFARRDLSTP